MRDPNPIIILLQTVLAGYTIWQLYKNWSGFWDERITVSDRRLASQLAFFILVPLGVLAHELGHSIATWQVGGTVQTFRWYGFSGYIIPTGDFSLGEYWWIYFAGNLVSILLGLISIWLLTRVKKRIVGEILYYFAVIQLIVSLIAYPLYSLLTRMGDWIQIYHLRFQPYAPFTLVAHLILLYKLWQLYHSQAAVYWRLSYNPETILTLQKLETEQTKHPCLESQLDIAHFLLNYGEIHTANKIANRLNRLYANDHRLKILQIAIAYYKSNYARVIKPAKQLINKNLLLEDRLRLYRILCVSYAMDNKPILGLDYAEQGLKIAPDDWKLHYNRALVYIKLKRYSEALSDLNLAWENCSEEAREWIAQMQKECFSKQNR